MGGGGALLRERETAERNREIKDREGDKKARGKAIKFIFSVNPQFIPKLLNRSN